MTGKTEEIIEKWEALDLLNNNPSVNKIYQNNLVSSLSGKTIEFDSVFFPVSMRVASRTIGLDLVSVQPMSGPRHEETPKERAIRIRKQRKEKFNKIFRNI